MAGPPEEKSRAWIAGPLRTPKQVARRLGVSTQTVIRYFDSGELRGADLAPSEKAKRVRKRAKKRMPRFRDDDVDRFEEKRFSRRN